MMRRRRTIIRPRTPIFLGCEGRSEAGYAALLGRFTRETTGVHVHIHVELLQPGAGDPLELVRRATVKIREIERRREAFGRKAVLIDRGDPTKNAAATRLAQVSRIDHVIWQDPDHEAMLLRHLDGCQTLRPSVGQTMTALRRHWPDYQKGCTVVQLAEKISIDHVRQACTVEVDLQVFLAAIGLL